MRSLTSYPDYPRLRSGSDSFHVCGIHRSNARRSTIAARGGCLPGRVPGPQARCPRCREAFAQPASRRDQIPNPRVELARLERLDDVVIGAALESLQSVLIPRLRREQHDRQKVRLGARSQHAHQLVPVGTGHHHVREHDVRHVPARELDALRAIRCLEHAETRSEVVADVVAEVRAVIDD